MCSEFQRPQRSEKEWVKRWETLKMSETLYMLQLLKFASLCMPISIPKDVCKKSISIKAASVLTKAWILWFLVHQITYMPGEDTIWRFCLAVFQRPVLSQNNWILVDQIMGIIYHCWDFTVNRFQNAVLLFYVKTVLNKYTKCSCRTKNKISNEF